MKSTTYSTIIRSVAIWSLQTLSARNSACCHRYVGSTFSGMRHTVARCFPSCRMLSDLTLWELYTNVWSTGKLVMSKYCEIVDAEFMQ